MVLAFEKDLLRERINLCSIVVPSIMSPLGQCWVHYHLMTILLIKVQGHGHLSPLDILMIILSMLIQQFIYTELLKLFILPFISQIQTVYCFPAI
jgi:hypothetical protein